MIMTWTVLSRSSLRTYISCSVQGQPTCLSAIECLLYSGMRSSIGLALSDYGRDAFEDESEIDDITDQIAAREVVERWTSSEENAQRRKLLLRVSSLIGVGPTAHVAANTIRV